jgi:hypothetical protein
MYRKLFYSYNKRAYVNVRTSGGLQEVANGQICSPVTALADMH